LSPGRRRRAAHHLGETLEVSERRACVVVEQHRSTQRYRAKPVEDEKRLVQDLHRLAGAHPRYGSPRITALLRREGWRVNHKRIERLWRREGLKVPQKQRRWRRKGHSANSCTRRRAERRNHVWSYDFIFDRTEEGRALKILSIVDEYTRECLVLHAARRIPARDVIALLQALIAERGPPEYLRSDNGPEFIAKALEQWILGNHIHTLFIAPGSPWENAYVESFHSRLRDEVLNAELFPTLTEARWVLARYKKEHNEERPHSSLKWQTPREFAGGGASSAGALASLRLRTRLPKITHFQLVEAKGGGDEDR